MSELASCDEYQRQQGDGNEQVEWDDVRDVSHVGFLSVLMPQE